MGTWEEESRELIESRDGIANDFSSDGGHHDENDGGDDRVGVDVNVSGESEGDDLSYGVDVEDEADLVHKFERVEIRKNGSEGEERRDFEEAEDGDGDGEYHAYPLRPYAEDCSFYVKTGTCKFGPNCRYNHPANTGFQIEDTKRGIEDGGGSVADAGSIDCKYFNSTGGCKYGDACRYNHFGQRAEREYLELNSMGLPIRPSVQECTFFLRNGSCGYGANCRFNHPDSGSTKEYDSGNSLPNGSVRSGINMPRNYAAGGPLQSYGGVAQRTQEPSNGLNMRNGAPYPPDLSPYYQAMRQNPGWNPNPVMNAFPANKTPLPQPALNNFPKRVDPPTHYGNQMQMEEFPERPGQPDCDYFMKTGTCKFKSACRYNHPLSRASTLHQPPVSSKGLYSRPPTMLPSETSDYFDSNSNNLRKNRLPSAPIQQRQMQNGEFPERPGQPECEYYMKTGQCKFNSACKYHHPKTRVPTPSQCALSEKGLPLRPGAKLCRNYEQQGMCKYGPNCLFNHPDDYSQAIPATAQFHNATNVAVAANLEPPPAANNSVSAWDDGWGM